MWYSAPSFWFGLLAGFVVGLVINAYMLRGRNRQELRTNKQLQRNFGLFNWALAVACAVMSFRVFG